MNFEGQNIGLQDALFVDNITGDVETFRVRSSCIARVLVFPPVNNYHRFLIHKVVETGFPEFTTFSVGEGVDRRTVVCFQQHLLDFTLSQTQNGVARNIQPENKEISSEPVKLFESVGTGDSKDTNEDFDEPAKLESLSEDLNSRENSKATFEIKTKDHCSEGSEIEAKTPSDQSVEAPQDENSTCSDKGMAIEDTKISDTHQNSKTINNGELSPKKTATNNPSKETKKRSKRPEMAVYVPPSARGKTPTAKSAPAPHTTKAMPLYVPPKARLAGSPANAAVQLTASGSVDPAHQSASKVGKDVTEQVVNEISVAVGGVQIESPEIDYLSFQTSDSTINIDQFGHVIELYDFPSDLKTNDLVDAFQAFTSRWDIKWVDDTHALGVFSSPEAAAEALAMRHPTILTRPLNMATPQSKSKARSVLDELLPYKPRPVSCTAPARRLLQWALGSGMRVPEASKQENERLREARRRKAEELRRKDESEEQRTKRAEDEPKTPTGKKHRHEHDDR